MSISANSAQRAYHLLRNLRKIFNHDLPNQVVVVHGLLQLLKIDEKSRLTPEGQEYLSRTELACKRVLQIIDTVKKITSVDAAPANKEPIALAELLRELAAAAKHVSNGGAVEIAPLPLKSIAAPRGALHEALLQLVTVARPAGATGKVPIRVDMTENRVEFCVGSAAPEVRAAAKPLAIEAIKSVEHRLALLYVQELAATWGGSLRGTAEATCFVIDVPQ